jgi:hypothetical protein
MKESTSDNISNRYPLGATGTSGIVGPTGEPGIPGVSGISNKIKDIHISQLDVGYLVKVGCKSFAITDKSKMLNMIANNLLHPADTEKLYFEGKLFND